MKLEEIFKTNPKLLQEPEVQKLIAYVDVEHRKTCDQCKMYQDFHDSVLDMVMNSELIVKGGKSYGRTMVEILKLLEKTKLF